MSGSQFAVISAGALVVVPLVAATVLIAVGSHARPRYARAHFGIDERGSSVPRSARHMSPVSTADATVPLGTVPDVVDRGPQALRDAVDMRPRRGAEVFG